MKFRGAWIIICIGVIAGFTLWRNLRISPKTALCRSCNIVVIVVDSLRADALPCYGYRLPTAPNLCAFSRSNTTFTNMFTNATWTRPTNMSIITGLYPQSHGMTMPTSNQLNHAIQTLPQFLREHEYQTTLVTNDQFNMGIELGFGRGYDSIQLTEPSLTPNTLQIWQDALSSIRTANKRKKPAFVYFHTDHVHDYFLGLLSIPKTFQLDPDYHTTITTPKLAFSQQMKQGLHNYFTGIIQETLVQSDIDYYNDMRIRVDAAKSPQALKRIYDELPAAIQRDIYITLVQDVMGRSDPEEYVRLSRHLYDESLRSFDQLFERILLQLQTEKLLDNTIVIITSDHGQVLGENGLVGHILGISDPELHVPLIMHVPGISTRQTDALVQTIDLYPTIADLIGLKAPSFTAGISLRDILEGNTNGLHNDYVISHTDIPELSYSIRTGKWRMVEITYPEGLYRGLYDLANDPGQTKSVAPENQGVSQTLSRLLHTTLGRQPVYPPVTLQLPGWKTQEERTRMLEEGKEFRR